MFLFYFFFFEDSWYYSGKLNDQPIVRFRILNCSLYFRVEKSEEEELSGKITRLVVEWEAKRQADEELLQAEIEQQDAENNQEDEKPEVSNKPLL